MDCCQCQGFETKFDRKSVAKKLKKYRKNGPKNNTRELIEVLQARGVGEMTLLDMAAE